MKMVLKDGKRKVLTLSYDDGVIQDIRFVEILDKHGLKCTFNLNTGIFLPEVQERERAHGRMKLSEAKKLYSNSGHEVAVHSLTHPHLDALDSTEMIHEIIEDRKNLEREFGAVVRGMAYPFGAYNDTLMDVMKQCGIVYSRTVSSTYNFRFPKNWLELHPTCHHNADKLDELIKRFVETPNRNGLPEMFYLWGHSYEFDNDNNWDLIERFAEYAGGHEHIWYATNIEIYDYVKAYERLQTSYDKKLIHNPSVLDVWIDIDGNVYCIKAGETLRL